MFISRSLRKYSYYLLSIFKLLFGFHNPILLAKIYLNLIQSGIQTLRLRDYDLQFKIRGAMDVWSIKETFLDRFYERYGFKIQPGWKIIDIGAGIGDYTIYAAIMQSNGEVFAFEPYPESFLLMQENLSLNRITNVQVFNQAISAKSGELILDLSNGEPLQFQSHLTEGATVKQSLQVNSLSLADALTRLGLESCDLLKLDCEGAEYSILFNTPQPVLERIRHIIMEYHDNLVEHNHNDLKNFLNEQGFQVETFTNPVHSHLGYLRAAKN